MFLPLHWGSAVTFVIDKSLAVQYFCWQCTCMSLWVLQVAKEFLKTALQVDIWAVASHVVGVDYLRADGLSRHYQKT